MWLQGEESADLPHDQVRVAVRAVEILGLGVVSHLSAAGPPEPRQYSPGAHRSGRTNSVGSQDNPRARLLSSIPEIIFLFGRETTPTSQQDAIYDILSLGENLRSTSTVSKGRITPSLLVIKSQQPRVQRSCINSLMHADPIVEGLEDRPPTRCDLANC